MAKEAKVRDVIKKLQAAGFAIRNGRGTHLVARHPDGRQVTFGRSVGARRGTLGPGAIIDMERRAKIDLDDWPPPNRKGKPRTTVEPVGVLADPEAAAGVSYLSPVVAQGSHSEAPPAQPSIEQPAGPGGGSGNAPQPIPQGVSIGVSSPDPALSIRDLQALVLTDPMGVLLREERGEFILTFTVEKRGRLVRQVLVGKELSELLRKARGA